MANGPDLIEIYVNPPDLFSRFGRYPKELEKEIDTAMEASLYHIHGSVPPYPRQSPNSSYRRTLILGNSLGITEGGGQTGFNEYHVKNIKKLGSGKYEARFGTRVGYAPDVIGTETQKPLFKTLGWWTMRTVKDKAEPGIIKIFKAMTERLVKFLGG